MDAIAFIWKTLLTKVSIKPLVLSMSFDCFLSGLSRLCGLPAPSVLFPQQPVGLKEPSTNSVRGQDLPIQQQLSHQLEQY